MRKGWKILVKTPKKKATSRSIIYRYRDALTDDRRIVKQVLTRKSAYGPRGAIKNWKRWDHHNALDPRSRGGNEWWE